MSTVGSLRPYSSKKGRLRCNFPDKGRLRCKSVRSGVVSPLVEGDMKEREGQLLSPLVGRNQGGKTGLPIRGGIKVGDGKRGWEVSL